MCTHAPTAPPAEPPQRTRWLCRFCHRQLGVVEGGGLRVLATAPVHYADRIEVRCPRCRRGHTFPITELPAPAP